LTADSPECFDGDWLAVREPADHAARSQALLAEAAAWMSVRSCCRIVDLGAGTGSNLRWTAPRLAAAQDWHLVDHDARLLERARRDAPAATPEGRPIRLRLHRLDLSDLSPALIEGADLVTASALFDLFSAASVDRLAGMLADTRAAGLFALTVDGRRGFCDVDGRPIEDATDAAAAALFNRHQRRDKGLGGALGPEAAHALPRALRAAGLRVRTARSDWYLPAGEARTIGLGRRFLDDWRAAASAADDAASAWLESWWRRRRDALDAGRIGLQVGHVDVLAIPMGDD
jgi:SAM-dependent methyltransferase